jgi:endoglycosylceramidase
MKFGEADLDALDRFGFNFIRLGVSWDKAEPEEGSIDLAYIRSLVEFARLAGERGMYVMPEVHKYGWCAPGSDWPMWSCDPPVKDGSDFIPMLRNARRFWNSPELQDKLIEFWKILVVEFRDLDNVMGYNPMNEPLDISMLVPGVFDKKLFAFYEKWIVAVRELDPERPACLEPSTANMIVPFKPPPFHHDNLVYAPHPYYVHGDGFKEPETNRGLRKKYKRNAREARGLNAPLIAGEYGGDPDTKFARRWLLQSFDLQDRYFAGAAIWVYDASDTGWAIVDSRLEPRPFFQKALNRPYPRHTAGRPLELKYSVEERAFTYCYEPDHAVSAPTEVYLPRQLAEGAVTVKGGTWSYDESSQIMLVRPRQGSREVVVEVR